MVLKQPGHHISRRRIDPDALKVIFRLRNQGFIAYLTGGAVQNLMQGIPPKDFDVVTDARPGQIKRRFSNARLIGRRFRLAHIHFRQGNIIEVATFRREPDEDEVEESDVGARRRNTYGTPREDAFRRDISINALFFDVATSSVIDYVGGLQDLEDKRIRIIGDPAERFEEDPVRVLRVIRHAARLGFDIDPDAQKAIRTHRHLLGDVSGSRLFEELNKDLSLKTRAVFRAMREQRILKYFLGGAGEAYESDDALFSRLISILDGLEKARKAGRVFSQEELFALVYWPWVERRFEDENGDLENIIKQTIVSSPSGAPIPKKLRASFIQILILIRILMRAKRTGRWRGAWQRRVQYPHASRLCFFLEKGRFPGEDESFEKLHHMEAGAGRRRRRPRRRRPRRVDSENRPSEKTSPPGQRGGSG